VAGTGIGRVIREMRTAAGMSLSDLAKATHYSKGYLSRVENGRDVPSLALVRAVDGALAANGALIATAPMSASGLPDLALDLAGRTVTTSNEVMMMATAEESARHGRRAGNSNVDDGQLDRLESALNHVAIGLLTEPLIPLMLDARQIRTKHSTHWKVGSTPVRAGACTLSARRRAACSPRPLRTGSDCPTLRLNTRASPRQRPISPRIRRCAPGPAPCRAPSRSGRAAIVPRRQSPVMPAPVCTEASSSPDSPVSRLGPGPSWASVRP
jgi:transcriptional regulator with XRE-family HTH domain